MAIYIHLVPHAFGFAAVNMRLYGGVAAALIALPPVRLLHAFPGGRRLHSGERGLDGAVSGEPLHSGGAARGPPSGGAAHLWHVHMDDVSVYIPGPLLPSFQA